VVALYFLLIATQFLATVLAARPQARTVRIATKLDPANAEYRDHMGRLELARLSPQDALPWLKSATALNPYNSGFWVDRAIAEEEAANSSAAQQSLKQALADDPHSAGLAWQAANLYLAAGATDDALREYRVVLEHAPHLTPQALQICWKIRPDMDALLANVVPAEADPAFLQILMSAGEWDAAGKVWDRMISSQGRIARSLLFDYVRLLMANGRASDAIRAWRQAADLAVLGAYQPTTENLLVNGDFGLDILNGGFDWRIQRSDAVSLALDPNERHSAARSLKISFQGAGIEDVGIRQFVAVEPHSAYDLSGYYKTQNLQGAGGQAITMQDFSGDGPVFSSELLHNADSWTPLSASFTTGENTQLMILRISRVPGGRPIQGVLWIAELKLAPHQQTEEAKP
jgi:tetratricopeptide (TPR) repeat protein